MVFLTFYYLASTSVASWRLRTMHQKIARVLDSKNSIVFLKKSDGNNLGMATAFATSDLCLNSSEATVQECFWSNEMSQGISIAPKQILYINPFITFPTPPSLIPFSYSVKDVGDLNSDDIIHALIEADLNPVDNKDLQVFEIEAFAHMMAWKIDTKLSILVKTDVKRLSQLIFATFVHNHYAINDYLSLTRLQTVNIDGLPQEIDQILNHSKKDVLLRSNELLSPVDWEKHLDGIKSLGVLANQACEFEYKKNLTEGKTGIIQPDLISSKNIEESLTRKAAPMSSPNTPKKSFTTMEKTDEKIRELKEELKSKNEKNSISSTAKPNDTKNFEEVVTPDSPKFPFVSPAKSPSHSIKSRISNEATSPKFPIASPAKKSFFNGEAKKNVEKEDTEILSVKDISDSISEILKTAISSTDVTKLSSENDLFNVGSKLKEEIKEVKGNNTVNVKSASEKFISNEIEQVKEDTSLIVEGKVPEKIVEANSEPLIESKQDDDKEAVEIKDSEKKNEQIKIEVKVEAEKENIAIEAKVEEKTETKPLLEVKPCTDFSVKPAPEAPIGSKSKSPNSSRRTRQQLMEAKPPNVLVYSDSTTTRTNVINTLGSILMKNVYTIYPLTAQQVKERIWLDNTTLLVVCGSVNGSDVSQIFLEFFFKGGKVLCLCSDLLRQVLPTYHTAEVREHELVQFSYGQWKNIKMMHHIFCYQPSPVRKHFSQDSDEPPKEKPPNGNPLIVLPRSIELKDELGMSHNVHVQVLGTEDTWKTPSLLMVYTDNGGKIIFSQIHLEIDPSFYESDEQKYQTLVKNDGLRHEIFSDVLSTHLKLSAEPKKIKSDDVNFTKGYFLGRHESKFEILEQLKPLMDSNNCLKIDGLSIKFCGKNEDPPTPETHCLPVMIHSCPDDFSTLDYFDALNTEKVGRLMIYSHILSNSMNIVNKVKFCHGLTIVSRELTQATGRGSNKWLSPPGCLMFTLQLNIPFNSPLGSRVSLIQHLIATAVVTGIKNQPGYESLELNVKWPNDIYANGEKKIGGLIVNSTVEQENVICNIGLGINLENSIPTTCINDMIAEYNKKFSKNLKPLTLETTLAVIFNEIENILNRIQGGDMEYLYNLYYSCWLHTDTTVKVISSSGQEKNGKILGIDEYGFLKIRLDNNMIESVQPDGNSFDMLRGLIVPKA